MLQFRSNLYCLVFDFLCLLSIPTYAFSSTLSFAIHQFAPIELKYFCSYDEFSLYHYSPFLTTSLHHTFLLFLPSQLGIILSPFLIILHSIIPPSPQHCTQLSFLPKASPPQQSSLIGAPFFPSKIGRNPGEDSGSGVWHSRFFV